MNRNKRIDYSKQSNLTLKKLRQAAEKKCRLLGKKPSDGLSAQQIAHLIDELQTHQIELEMQNDELHKVQLELQQSQAQFYDLYQHAPVGYLTLDTKGLIIGANFTAADLLAITKSDLIKKPLNQFIIAEDQDIYYFHCQQMINGKEHDACELKMLRADNRIADFTLESKAVRDKQDRLIQFRATLSDSTERKQAEVAVRESEKRLSFVIDASEMAYWDWDIPADKVTHNDYWHKMLGLAENSTPSTSKSLENIIHEDDRETVTAQLKQLLAGTLAGTSRFHSEHRLRHADGHYIWVQANAIIVKRGKKDRPLRMIGSYTDISERRLHEQQQRLHQHHYERLLKLEVANHTVAAIAHELNQPLSAAASYIDASQRLLKKETFQDQKITYAVDQGVQQIQRAGQVIHELFNFLHLGGNDYCRARSQ